MTEGDRAVLNVRESLYWEQTWDVHFEPGEFYQTEAVSDSVRLASDAGQYYLTGVYTSSVFDAGRPVDWLRANWNGSAATAFSITVEFRTGNTITPDNTWSAWDASLQVWGRYSCIYALDMVNGGYVLYCYTSMIGIESSQFIQYRVPFSHSDPSHTVNFNDITITYGIHAPLGTVITGLISPIDLGSWKQVFYTCTIPVSTALAIDVLAPNGTVLLPDVLSGDSLTSIDPIEYPSIKLRATLATDELSRTPELDAWGLRWVVKYRYYLPVMTK
jgi:hypothetical protein